MSQRQKQRTNENRARRLGSGEGISRKGRKPSSGGGVPAWAWVVGGAVLIAELLVARGHAVVHLLRPGRREPHRLYDESEIRDGRLYLCGSPVA